MKFHSKIFGWEYAWQEFAVEAGGSAEIDVQANPSVKHIQVPIQSGGKIKFIPDPHKLGNQQVDTTVLAEYDSADNFVFGLHTEKFLNQVSKLLGAQDIRIGDEVFDARFQIQSNDPNRFIQLLRNDELRLLLMERPDIHLKVLTSQDKLPHGGTIGAGKHVIHYSQHKVLDSFEQLSAVARIMDLMVNGARFGSPEEAAFKPRFSESLLHR